MARLGRDEVEHRSRHYCDLHSGWRAVVLRHRLAAPDGSTLLGEQEMTDEQIEVTETPDTVDVSEPQDAVPVSDAKWYAVHTHSGYEKRAKIALLERAKSLRLGHLIEEVMIPEENVVEVKRGERHTSTRKLFPGYILAKMVVTDQTWHLVKDTPKITGFIGGTGRTPTPVPESEVLKVTNQIEEGLKSPKPIQRFEAGDQVRVIDGPFQNFSGTVEEVNADKAKLRVLVSIFGRATPIELDYVQVESTG